MSFRALVLDNADGAVTAAVRAVEDSDLPDGDVSINVEWSSLNYKDGLIVRNKARLVRIYPHIPGIDLAGTVGSSGDSRFSPGDTVVLNGWRVGEVWWGGYAERARVKADWLVRVPPPMTTRQSMAIGTAGLTSMLAVQALEAHGLVPGTGPVLVTGASGGVGSIAVHVLARLGYEVTASTGKPDQADHLRALGASAVIDRNEIGSAPDRPLLSERWAGCVDAVGGATLARVLAELRYGASVAACGNTAGNDLPTSVIPFLLRGVNLLGIDSVMCPVADRAAAWSRLAEVADLAAIEAATVEVGLEGVPGMADEILGGRVAGRVLVRP